MTKPSQKQNAQKSQMTALSEFSFAGGSTYMIKSSTERAYLPVYFSKFQIPIFHYFIYFTTQHTKTYFYLQT